MNIIKQQGKNIAVKNINTNSNKKTTEEDGNLEKI